ncbi:TetR/AcrR family transcriptional regulator [Erwiniaceae bacterium BAC15a-03b]|uniref:TetR/AcrR family transcriptional regulator n=1 Tax=Winslowiella arboricola TaxID=2978220 RepID=A0A9J6PNF8_9GAMM|nr:TetR/AcrR family transcriptional regulator [Winslowiella arboricola]MCU5774391.1 TetR/AcrR family transcriptional regulator [Winslowiella arboricola]MCU5778938.1 TetR/AcrR family transcriptional regulator [Winslowiella arboricola]
MKEKTRRGAGREILVSSAKHLFIKHGTANVGINDVTADAGLAKMTLYNNFSSKDALIAEVYQLVAEEILEMCRDAISKLDSEQGKIISLFDNAIAQKEYQRGCPMNHAVFQSAEPDGEIFHIVQSYKRQLRQVILDCLSVSRINRQQLADQILILLDGFALQQYIKAVDSPVESVKVLIKAILNEKE